MKYKKYDYKVAYLDFLIRSYEGAPIYLLDMGSGTSKDFVEVLHNTAASAIPALK